jgi:membrane protease YdiL (CAAX protease family)
VTLLVLFATVGTAAVPMIVAGFLWPADWPLIWRQVVIGLWGMGVVFGAERWFGGGSFRATLVRLGATPPRWVAVVVAVMVAFTMFLSTPILAYAKGVPWGFQPDWGSTLFGVILVNGLAEEVIHRAFLFHHLREKFSYSTATTIAAAIFAAQHLYLVATIGLVAGLASVVLGVLLTLPFISFYEQGGRSIVPTAILHTGTNASVLLLLSPTGQQRLLMPHMAVVLTALYGGMVMLALLRRSLSATRGVGSLNLGASE